MVWLGWRARARDQEFGITPEPMVIFVARNLVVTAALVLGAALTGDDGDALEEDPEGKPMGVTTANGVSAGFTAAAPVPDSPPAT